MPTFYDLCRLKPPILRNIACGLTRGSCCRDLHAMSLVTLLLLAINRAQFQVLSIFFVNNWLIDDCINKLLNA